MHGGLPFIGISTLVYGLVGLGLLAARAGDTVRAGVRKAGGSHAHGGGRAHA